MIPVEMRRLVASRIIGMLSSREVDPHGGWDVVALDEHVSHTTIKLAFRTPIMFFKPGEEPPYGQITMVTVEVSTTQRDVG